MSFINNESKEIHNKIVYCGPNQSGKTSCLNFIKEHSQKIKMDRNTISLKKGKDINMLVFSIGKFLDFETFFHVYSFPELPYEETTYLIRNCDGIIFLANSDISAKKENKQSLKNLAQNFKEQNIDILHFPMAVQYNKRDKKPQIPLSELRADINLYNNKDFESSAKEGYGVVEPLNHICRSILVSLKSGELP